MPLHIIRQDITKFACDAIVNSANNTLLGGGGVDGAIHKVAGAKLLEKCKTLGGCETGDAKITKGYNLPCKYVIHTVGPIWKDGNNGEADLLKSCYQKSLILARENECESVSFPLISSGGYAYPKAEALSVAVETISEFLFDNEMTVYIVVFDKESYQISEELFDEVAEYIDDNYVDRKTSAYIVKRKRIEPLIEFKEKAIYDVSDDYACFKNIPKGTKERKKSLKEMLSHLDDSFSVSLLKLIDLKGITDVECYKKANVSKQTWYKIMNEKHYKPSKNTVISFAIALELSLEETKRLLSTVGFTLSKSSKFDVIIEYFLLNEEYNIFTINETLFKFDQTCLGV